MQRQVIHGIAVATIGPGEYYVSDSQEVIKTLLGSCVAVCLYDPVTQVSGMNHFLLAADHGQHGVLDSRAGMYGIHAMELLINGMLKSGAERGRLQSKVFGGGNVLKVVRGQTNHFDIGNANVDFVLRFLEREHIPIVTRDVRGNSGRVIYMDGGDFAVYRKLIDIPQDADLIKQERSYMAKTVTAIRQPASPTITFWDDKEGSS
jgi:chemotaxis protein CheD